jgi:hypothetical protein
VFVISLARLSRSGKMSAKRKPNTSKSRAIGDWIRQQTDRVNFLMPVSLDYPCCHSSNHFCMSDGNRSLREGLKVSSANRVPRMCPHDAFALLWLNVE